MSTVPTVPIDPPVPTHILLLIGPLVFGSLMSCILFGISIVQLYIYNVKFDNDRFMIQFSVYMIFALDTLQTVTVWVLAWHTQSSGWGRMSALIYPGWTYSSVPAGTGILSAWVQIFYAWRIHVMVHWRIVPIIIITVALAQAGAALSIGITFCAVKNILLLHNMFPRTIVWLGGAALVDLTISISMVYILYSAKRRAIGRTEKMLNRLIRSTVETGIVTSLCAILELSFFLGIPTTNIHVLFALMLSKVYSNAFMTSLNSRRGSSDSWNTQGTWNSFDIHTMSRAFAHTSTTMGVVHVSTDIEVSSDNHFEPKKQDFEEQQM